MNNIENFELNIFIIFMTILGLMLVVSTSIKINDLKRELRYINLEIRRTSGSEQKHWLRLRAKTLRPVWITLALSFLLIAIFAMLIII